jgi:hypothetical protein
MGDDLRPSAPGPGRAKLSDVFVRDFRELDIPFDEAESALAQDPTSWLPLVASATDERGRYLLAEVGFGSPLRLHKRVEVEVSEPYRLAGKTLVPIRWSTGAESSPLPVMEGDLEIAPFGPGRSQLSMNGRYTPPFGALGGTLDRALLHRVAEATVRDFVDRVARALCVEVERRRHPSAVGTAADPMPR